MQVIIDGDGCPVVDITVAACCRYGIPCTILCDTAHEFHREGADTRIIDKGTDSVDLAVANLASPGDLVVTQDYGLASMCLARKARILHQDGWEYTQWNIDALMLQRHEARKLRAAGGRMKGPRKRTAAQDAVFRSALESILNQAKVQG